MIGIVVVSHSHALAHAAVGLAAEMVEADQLPHIEIAAGLDDETFGTDAAAISEAITAADSADGVLVLLDLGSAILSAEMALEFVDPDVADRVALSSAPLVEGLVAAVVTASGGAALDRVKAEAERGLAAKREHLDGNAALHEAVSDEAIDDAASSVPGSSVPGSSGSRWTGSESTGADSLGPDALTRKLVVGIPHGLHARPAARFVACVNRFGDTEVRVRNLDGADKVADAGSLSAVASLGVKQGHRIEVQAAGEHAKDVLDALTTLAAAGFGDGGAESAPSSRRADKREEDDTRSRSFEPTMGSGLEAAIGVIWCPESDVDAADYEPSGDNATESERLNEAIASACRDLKNQIATTRAYVGAAEAEIFEAHMALVQDLGLAGPARQDMERGVPAALAWQRAGEAVAAQFDALDDDYQRERAQDVRSVTTRVLRQLIESGADADGDAEDGTGDAGAEQRILVVQELDPAAAASLDAEHVGGIVTIGGGSTGHGVIIASARGVPVLTGIREAADFASGAVLAFDVRDRRVVLDPDDAQRTGFEQLLRDRAEQQEADRAAAGEPGQTQDGLRISVKANVTSAPEAARAVELGAEGSGLVRTEVMFGEWRSAPTVQEQVAEFTAVAKALDGRVMTIRTWDIGADKPLAFWKQEPEQNPFLGVRGLRSFVGDSAVLLDQLEAVCVVAADYPVRVMFPMVATVEEVQWALDRLAEVANRVEGGRPDSLEVGIMIEVPCAALRAEAMSVLLDFVSIGTNDLTQYTLAAERGNAGVEHLFDPLDPAVLSLIASVCRDVPDGVSVGVCGGAASDPAVAALLVGLGVDDLSATPVAVPRVKAALRRHTATTLQDLARRALRCDSASEVRDLLKLLIES